MERRWNADGTLMDRWWTGGLSTMGMGSVLGKVFSPNQWFKRGDTTEGEYTDGEFYVEAMG